MIIIFILIGGLILRCGLSLNFLNSYCAITDYKVFGAMVSVGALEMIFEMRGLVAVFQRKQNDGGEEDEE